MLEDTQSFRSAHELKDFVHRTLCEKENLLADQFRMTEETLYSRGNPCALQFTIRGPRAIKLGAIWAIDQGTILFYDTRGERYQKVNLQQTVQLDVA